MANFSYKLTKVTTLKASGILDTDTMTISIDGEEKRLSTLLSDFNGADIDFVIKIKAEKDIDPPDDGYDENSDIWKDSESDNT